MIIYYFDISEDLFCKDIVRGILNKSADVNIQSSPCNPSVSAQIMN